MQISWAAKVQVLKYLAVGVSTALLELILFQLILSLVTHDVVSANVIAVVIATATNFIFNRNTTFQSSSNPFIALVKYLALFAFNTTFSSVTIALISGAGIPAVLVKLGTMCCITSWNFVLFKKVVFK